MIEGKQQDAYLSLAALHRKAAPGRAFRAVSIARRFCYVGRPWQLMVAGKLPAVGRVSSILSRSVAADTLALAWRHAAADRMPARRDKAGRWHLLDGIARAPISPYSAMGV